MSDAGVTALDSSVLVLNANYTALHIISVRRAFTLLYKQVAEVIHYDDDDAMASYDFIDWLELSRMRQEFSDRDGEDYIRTVSLDLQVPRIIRLLLYDRLPRRRVKFNRRNIYARDGSRCQYCGKTFSSSELTLDHIIPRSRGGEATWENIVCACMKCNVRKGGRLPKEAHMKLIRIPTKPKRPPVLRIRLRSDKYRSWRHFVDEAYWSVELQ